MFTINMRISNCFIFFVLCIFLCLNSNYSYAFSREGVTINYGQKFVNFKSFDVKEILIDVEDDKINQDLSFIYAQYLNKYMSEDLMQELGYKLNQYFLEQDYLLPKVSIIEQNIKTGLLHLKIKFRSIDHVIISNDKGNELLEEYTKKIVAFKPARVKYISKYLTLIAEIPGYKVKYQLKIYKNKQAYLMIDVKKIKGMAKIGVSNHGSSSVGILQESVSMSSFSPFGKNDSFQFVGITTNKPSRLYFLSFDYAKPINSSGTSINFSISDTVVNTNLNQYGIATPNSKYLTIKGALNHYLHLDYKQSLLGTFTTSYRRVKTYGINPNNISAIDISARYYSVASSLRYLSKDSRGKNKIDLSIERGINGTYRQYSTPSFVFNPKYTLINVGMSREQDLSNNFSLFISSKAAKINTKAPNELLLGLGGAKFARGYDYSTLVGGRILAASFEVRYHKMMINNKILKTIQPYVFYDYGYLGKKSSDTNISTLSSYGSGIKAQFNYNVNCNLEVAVPLNTSYMVTGTNYVASPRALFYISKSFKY